MWLAGGDRHRKELRDDEKRANRWEQGDDSLWADEHSWLFHFLLSDDRTILKICGELQRRVQVTDVERSHGDLYDADPPLLGSCIQLHSSGSPLRHYHLGHAWPHQVRRGLSSVQSRQVRFLYLHGCVSGSHLHQHGCRPPDLRKFFSPSQSRSLSVVSCVHSK